MAENNITPLWLHVCGKELVEHIVGNDDAFLGSHA